MTTVDPGHIQGLRRPGHLPGPARRGARLPGGARVRARARRLQGRRRHGDAAGLRVAVGHDMRLHSPALAEAFCRGLVDEGCEVLDIGMVGTEMVYYAIGSRGARRRRVGDRLAQSQGVGRLQALCARARSRFPATRASRTCSGSSRPATSPSRRPRARSSEADIYEEFQHYVLGFIEPRGDPADGDRARRRQRDGGPDDRADHRLVPGRPRTGSTSSRTASSPATSRIRCSRRTAS